MGGALPVVSLSELYILNTVVGPFDPDTGGAWASVVGAWVDGDIGVEPGVLRGEDIAVCRRKFAGRGTGDSLGLFAAWTVFATTDVTILGEPGGSDS